MFKSIASRARRKLDKVSRKSHQSLDQIKNNESGNIFFTLFGAVAVVGVLGAVTVSTMRGPLSTMVEVQSRTKAESEMAVASRLAMLEATEAADDGDCDADGFVEPLEFTVGAGPTGGGLLPSAVASARIDPWGTDYGYCVWDGGTNINSGTCDQNGTAGYQRLSGDGSNLENYTVIAIISAGPDQNFDTTCTDGPPSLNKAGDDIIVEYTYAAAAAATDGLWNLKSGDPDTATIDKGLEVTGGGIDLTASTAALTLGAASMLFPTEGTLGTCNAANNNLLRVNTSTNPDSLEICSEDSGAPGTYSWESVTAGSTSAWTINSSDEIYFNSVGTTEVGIGTTTPNNTLDIVGTLDVSGAVTFGDTLGVTGTSTLAGLNAQATTTTTLGATGAVDFDSTMTVDGATTLGSTLDAQGTIANSTGDVTLGDDVDITGALDAQGTITNSTGDVNIGDNIVVTGTSDLQGTVSNSTGDITLGDDVDITGTLDAQGTISNSTGNVDIGDTVDISNDLNVTGTIDVDGSADIDGTMEADDYTWNGNDFTPATCSSGSFNRWDGSSWACETDTSGSGSGGINAGVFEVNDTPDPDVVRMKSSVGTGYGTVDFVFGSTQLDDTGDTDHDARMFFDKSKGAFRAGRVTDGAWDDGSVGDYSIVLGNQSVASATSSIAIGESNFASGYRSVALGSQIFPSGSHSIGLGRLLLVSGDEAMAIGLGVPSGTYPRVSGDSSLGIFMGDQANVDVTAANTFSLMGGTMAIGSVAASTGGDQDLELDVTGDVGADNYCDANGDNCFTASGVTSGSTGGIFEIVSNVARVKSTAGDYASDDFVFGSTQLADSGDADHDSRFWFDKSKGAFRAGYSDSTQWNDSNVGIYSVAMGWRSIADGNTATALGSGTTASGRDSLATGSETQALGLQSMAMGYDTIAAVDDSYALGREVRVDGLNSMGIGLGIPAGTDPIVSGANSFGIFMGDQSGVDITATNTFSIMGGTMAIGSVAASTGGDQDLELDVTGDVGADNYCDANGDNCFAPTDVGGLWTDNTTHITRESVQILDAGETVATAGIDAGSTRNIIFHTDKTALRVGTSRSGGLLETDFGDRSIGVGVNPVPSGTASAAFGDSAVASGYASFATGQLVSASGANSLVIGRKATVSGNYSATMGLGDATGTYPTVSGASSFGIFMGDQSGYDLSTSNRMALVGGDFLIDDDGTAGSQGCIRYTEGTGLEYSDDCSTFTAISSLGNAGTSLIDADNDTQIQVEEGADDDTIRFDTAGTERLAINEVGGMTLYGSSGDTPAIEQGDACTVAGATHIKTETDHVEHLLCDGSNWKHGISIYDGALPGASVGTGLFVEAPDSNSTRVHIKNGSSATGGADIRFGGSFGTSSYARVGTDGDDAVTNHALRLYTYGVRDIKMITDDVEEMRISSGGNVGLGDFSGGDTIDSALHLQDGDIRLDGGAANEAGCIRFNDTSDELEFSDDCTTFVPLNTAGAGALAIDDLTDGYTDYATSYNFFLGHEGGGNIGADTLQNTGIGIGALDALDNASSGSSLGDHNTAVGYNALTAATNAYYTTAIGDGAGDSITSGGGNTAVGAGSLGNLTSYSGNSAIGAFSLNNVSGTDNSALGERSGIYLRTADRNTLIGHEAGQGNTTDYTYDGDDNVIIGANAAQNLDNTNDQNTIIGSGAAAGLTGGGSSNILIGYGVDVTSATSSNELNIGNLIYGDLANGDFIVGSYQLDDTGTGTEDARMFFDKSKGAFRAGQATGAEWDDANVGTNSIALGNSSTASGNWSVALGSENTASGLTSFTAGWQNTSSSFQSFAAGRETTASAAQAVSLGYLTQAAGDRSVALGREATVTSSGDYSFAFGLGVPTGADPQVSGANSFGIFMGDQGGYDLTTASRMALVGGDFLIDDDGTAGSQGCIRYLEGTGLQFSHDCSTFTTMGSVSAGALAIDDLSDAYTDYATDFNMFMGDGAGANIASGGQYNIALGQNALNDVTVSDDNIAIGYNSLSLYDSTTNGGMIAIGQNALDAATDGRQSVAIGTGALGAWDGTPGSSDNTAVGHGAGGNLSSGAGNSLFGSFSASNLTGADSNVFAGFLAGAARSGFGQTGVNNNVVIGDSAGQFDTGASDNVIIGADSGDNVGTGDNNILIGSDTEPSAVDASNELNIGGVIHGEFSTGHIGIGVADATAIDSTAIFELDSTTLGFLPPRMTTAQRGAIGSPSDGLTVYDTDDDTIYVYDNDDTTWRQLTNSASVVSEVNDLTDGLTDYTDNNFYIGQGAGGSNGTILYYDNNMGVGINAMANIGTGCAATSNTNCTQNTAIGADSMNAATTAWRNTAVGHDTLAALTTGYSNVAVGANAGESLTTGQGNIAIGSGTLDTATTAYANVAIGGAALTASDADYYNTAVGYDSLVVLDGGIRNTALGAFTGYVLTSGSNNTFLGYGSGGALTSGGSSTFIGHSAGGDQTSGSSNIAIGYDIQLPSLTGSDQMNIGNLLYGDLSSVELGIGDFSSDTIDSTLHLASGDIRLDGGAANEAGCLRFNDTSDQMEYSDDCSTFTSLASLAGGLWTDNTTHITRENFHILDAGLAAGSTTASLDGDGTYAFYDPDKGAIRVGAIGGGDDSWEDANIGINSVAMGENVEASGFASFVMGGYSTASADYAISMGHTNLASGTNSVAIGDNLGATTTDSILIGRELIATSGTNQIVMGNQAQASGNYSFSIGLGAPAGTSPTVSGANSMGIFMGDQSSADISSATTMAILGGDFIVGSPQIDDDADANHDSRLFFDKSQSSFRAGIVDSNQWDNRGTASVAFGYNTGASGDYSFAAGRNTSASGNRAFAMGQGTSASNDSATAIGRDTTAAGLSAIALGQEVASNAHYSMTIGLADQTGTDPQVSVSNSMAIILDDQSGYDLSTSNRMALVGGDFLIDDDGTAGSQGCIRYTEGTGLEYSDDCSTFTAFSSGGLGLWTDNTTHITREGVNILDAGATMESAGLDFGNPINGLVMFTDRNALVGGYSNGKDSILIGNNSFSWGSSTSASGAQSIALGNNTGASGTAAIAIGGNVSATGSGSIAIGTASTSSTESVALGSGVNVSGIQAMGLGLGETAGTPPEISGNNSLGIFMGDQDGETLSDTNTVAIIGATGGVGIGTVSPSVTLDLGSNTDALLIPNGTTGERPTASNGMMRYNTTTNLFEMYQNGSWTNLAGASVINDLSDATTDYATDFNMFMGDGAGANIASGGQYNIALGQNALNDVTVSDRNIAIGYGSLDVYASATDGGMMAIGYDALGAATDGRRSVAIGDYALSSWNGTPGVSGNTALGAESGIFLSSGASNTFLGGRSAINVTDGSFNVFVGQNSGSALSGFGQTGVNNNVVIGQGAGYFDTGASDNVLIGYGSGNDVGTGDNNILIGSGVEPSAVNASNELNIGGTIYGDLSTDRIGLGVADATAIDASAILELDSTTLGFLPPRMTTVQRGAVSSPSDGLTVYDTDDDTIYVYDGDDTTWRQLSISGSGLGAINDLSDSYTDYATDHNVIMGRTSAAALTGSAQYNTFVGEGAGATSANSTATTDQNTALGYDALTSLTSGSRNTTMGTYAGAALTTGERNTLIGVGAGSARTGDDDNVAIGAYALQSYPSGNRAVAIGSYAMEANGGSDNIGIGYYAGAVNDGINSVVIGSEAGRYADASSRNVMLGHNAGTGTNGVTSGVDNNTFIGYSSGTAITSGDNNIFLGYQTGDATTTGSSNILIGYDIDASGATASNELNIGGLITGTIGSGLVTIEGTGALTVASGTTAQRPTASNGMMRYNTTTNLFEMYQNGSWTNLAGASVINDLSDSYTDYATDYNIIMGRTSAAALTSGAQYNLYIGQDAGATSGNSTATTDHNIAFGYQALESLTSGSTNLVIGTQAGEYITTGGGNIGVGTNALQWQNTGNDNIAIGLQSQIYSQGDANVSVGTYGLYDIHDGNQNTAIGSYALFETRDKTANTAIGYESMYYFDSNDETGNIATNNTALGHQSLRGSTTATNNTGTNNTALGKSTLLNNTSGSNNIAIGHQTGDLNTTGSGNILIGYDIDASGATASNELNIGGLITGTIGSGLVTIEGTGALTVPNGTTAQEPTAANGMIRYDTTTNRFRVYENGAWVDLGSAVSDERLKDNIKALDQSALDRLAQVNTYSYTIQNDQTKRKQYGVIAQQLENIFPELVHQPQKEEDMKSVDYNSFIALLIEANKTVQKENATLKEEITRIQTTQAETAKTLDELTKQVALLNKMTLNNTQKASMEGYWLILLLSALFAGFGLMVSIRQRRAS